MGSWSGWKCPHCTTSLPPAQESPQRVQAPSAFCFSSGTSSCSGSSRLHTASDQDGVRLSGTAASEGGLGRGPWTLLLANPFHTRVRNGSSINHAHGGGGGVVGWLMKLFTPPQYQTPQWAVLWIRSTYICFLEADTPLEKQHFPAVTQAHVVTFCFLEWSSATGFPRSQLSLPPKEGGKPWDTLAGLQFCYGEFWTKPLPLRLHGRPAFHIPALVYNTISHQARHSASTTGLFCLNAPLHYMPGLREWGCMFAGGQRMNGKIDFDVSTSKANGFLKNL